jgi:hypothetical protein
LNSKRHAVCDGTGKPVRLFLTAGQTSDYTGARHLLPVSHEHPIWSPTEGMTPTGLSCLEEEGDYGL